MVNKVILVGRLGGDPEIRSTDGGKKVANFSLATDETYKDRNGDKIKKVEWFKIVAWDKLAEIIEEYVHKGDQIYIEGKLQTRQWTDKRDGGNKQTTEVIANVMRMLGGNTKAAAAGGDEGSEEESLF